jgi:hypothetical protein
MRSFKFIVYFFVIHLIVLIISELFIRSTASSRNTTIRQLVQVMTSHKEKIIIGDSQTRSLFHTHLSDFSNQSVGGATMEIMYEVLKYRLKKFKVSHVILLASPQVFDKSRIKNKDQNYQKINSNVLYQQFILSVSPLILNQLRYVIRDINKPLEDEGSLWSEIHPDERLKKIKDRIEFLRPHQNFQKYYKRYLKILNLLKINKTKVCLLKAPTDKIFDELTKKENDYQTINSWFKEQADIFGFHYVDGADFVNLETIKLFRNQDHLDDKLSYELANKIAQVCFKYE